MRTELKILPWWLGLVAIAIAISAIPDGSVDTMMILNVSIQLLLGVFCVFIALHSSPQQRAVFLNFAFFFLFILILLASGIFGQMVTHSYNGYLALHLFIHKFVFYALLLNAILYTVLDYLLDRRSVLFKYACSAAGTLAVALFLFSPFLANPGSMADAPEYRKYTAIASVAEKLKTPENRTVTAAQIKHALELTGTAAVVVSGSAVSSADVDYYLPYLNTGGSTAIYWKQVELRSVAMNLIATLLIIAFLFSAFRSPRAYHAYLDKILIVFLALGLLNVLHTLGTTYATDFTSFLSMFETGHIVTMSISILLLYVVDLKLRFVLSASGKYYEETLLTTPWNVTRFRDEIDSMLLKTFFTRDSLRGRFFAERSAEESTKSIAN